MVNYCSVQTVSPNTVIIKVNGAVWGNSLHTTLYAYLFEGLVRAKEKGREIFAKWNLASWLSEVYCTTTTGSASH